MASTTEAPNASDNAKAEEGYVIIRTNDPVEPENIVFEQQKRGDTIRIKYKVGGKPKIMYLQSAPSYVRTPLLVEGALQSTVDFDLCEACASSGQHAAQGPFSCLEMPIPVLVMSGAPAAPGAGFPAPPPDSEEDEEAGGHVIWWRLKCRCCRS
jgi:hypothetical protein